MSLKSNLAASLAKLGDSQNAVYQAGMKNARTKPLPPPGLHRCEIIEVDGYEYTDKATGQEYLNIETTFRVVDGESAGFTFAHTLWGNSDRDQGALLDLAAIATGEVFTEFTPAVTALGGAKGAVVTVNIKQYASKKEPGVMKKAVNFVS